MYNLEDAAPFDDGATSSLLSLLAMTALSDKKLYAVEVETFIKMARDLETHNCFTESLSEAKLLMWFELNKDQLLDLIKTPDFGTWHEYCLIALENTQNKAKILQAMIEIAKSDDEFHFSEKALVMLTARRWNIAIETL